MPDAREWPFELKDADGDVLRAEPGTPGHALVWVNRDRHSRVAAGDLPSVVAALYEACGLPVPPALEDGELLTSSQVAALFQVDPKSVARWAAKGQLACMRTPGGHTRFRAEDVRPFLVFRGAK